MKTYVQPGNTITLTAPYAVASGDGLLVGSIFGAVSGTAALGEPVEAVLAGVYELKKIGSQAWAVGDCIYRENTARQTTKITTSNTQLALRLRRWRRARDLDRAEQLNATPDSRSPVHPQLRSRWPLEPRGPARPEVLYPGVIAPRALPPTMPGTGQGHRHHL